MVNLSAVFVSSWPLDFAQGSGTALFVNSLRRAVETAGTRVELINPALDTADYVQFTLERLWFNTRLAEDARLGGADWILGVDYDGYAVPRRPNQPFIATARAVFADLVDTEPEPFRGMLRTQAFFEGHNLRRADLVVVPSAYARHKALEYYQLDPAAVRVVPNGIDLPAWEALLAAAPEPDPARRPTVLAVSKLYPRKKIGTLVAAASMIRQQYPDVEFRIVGGGYEFEALQRLAIESGVAGSFTWLGDVSDRRRVAAEYKNCHVFVHPSIQDAFANVCLEAMATARPLVVSDAASMPDLVRQAGSGLVVPPLDPPALAEAVNTLLADGGARQRYGQAGRAFAQTLTWEAAAGGFLAQIAPLVSRPPAAP